MSSGPDAGDGTADEQDLGPTTTLRVHYPTGSAPGGIFIRGDNAKLSWSSGKKATQGTDVFTFTTRNLKAGASMEWKPLLADQTWSKGPNYRVTAGQTVEAWPHFTHDNGAVERVDAWWSNGLKNNRPLWIYTPPSYSEQTSARFPVVYMHDGQNLFDPDWSFQGVTWRVAEAMDQGIANGSLREAIVIGVGNTNGRIWEYTPSDGGYGGGGANAYISFLTDELKPQVDLKLRTLTGRADTALIGSSLGGLVTAWAGTTRPDVFGLLGELSPSTWWDNTLIITTVAATKNAAIKPSRVYVDSGDAGNSNDDVTNTTALFQTYSNLGGIAVQHTVGHGDTHTESAWARRLPGALKFLLGPR